MSDEAGALRSILAIFGVKFDDHELKKGHEEIEAFSEQLEGFEAGLKKVGKVLAEAFGAEKLFEFAKEGLEAASHVQDLSNKLDISASSLQSFADVAKDAGVDMDSAGASLSKLQKNLGEATTKGGPAAAAFAKLGLDAGELSKAGLDDQLGSISDALAKLPDQNQRTAAAMELFGRQGAALLPILNKGSDALKEQLEEVERLGNGLGDKFYQDSKQALDGFEHFGIGLRSLKERALDALLPAITKLGDYLQKMVGFVLDLDKKYNFLKPTMIAITAVIGVGLVDALGTAAAALWTLLAPILPIIAAVGALAFLFKDLWDLMSGGDSVIGNLIDKFGGLGAKKRFIAELRDIWKEVLIAINQVAYALGYTIGIIVGLGVAIAQAKPVQIFFASLVALVADVVRGLIGFIRVVLSIPSAIKQGSFKPIADIIDKTGEAIFGKHEETKSTDVGVPQAAVDLWNQHHATEAQRRDTIGEGEAYGRTTSVRPNVESRPILKAPLVAQATARLPDRGGGSRGEGSRTVEQNNVNHVVVHTASDQPRAVGEAVGAGVATASQKDLNAALAAVVKP